MESERLTDRDFKVAAIQQHYFPRLRRLRHLALVEFRRPVGYILPAHADPGPHPDGDPAVPARIMGQPLVFVGEYLTVMCADGKVFQEAE